MGNKGTKNIDNVSVDQTLEEKLVSIFRRFDLDNSNSIEKSEILEKFKRTPEEGKEVARLFDQMDND